MEFKYDLVSRIYVYDVYMTLYDFKLAISAGKSTTKKRGQPSAVGSLNQGIPSTTRIGISKCRNNSQTPP